LQRPGVLFKAKRRLDVHGLILSVALMARRAVVGRNLHRVWIGGESRVAKKRVDGGYGAYRCSVFLAGNAASCPPAAGLPEYHRRARVSCPVILRPGVPTFRAGTVRNDNGHSALRGAWRLARTYSLALGAYLDYCP